jgi:ATP-dependent metalloprotease
LNTTAWKYDVLTTFTFLSTVHKATIMPRGQSLGMVTMLPEGDQTSQSLKQMRAMMDVSMGGRVAEELIFGKDEATSGASSDISNATNIARNMVTKYGFSEEIGLVHHGGQTGEEHASDETRNKIDSEVKKLTDSSYKRAKDLLTTPPVGENFAGIRNFNW